MSDYPEGPCIECGKRSVVLIRAKSLLLNEQADYVPFCAEHGSDIQRARLRVLEKLGQRNQPRSRKLLFRYFEPDDDDDSDGENDY